ncbi:PREDICTED: probable ubiquitin-conjugating enzyme E2 24 isoform X2 [Nelumbo nucifera]|uniref:E2 ubiquitin-conjugating enzyme n=1 Tax=Nelumbo nucifera TaxID=4432 RepID=A0A1U8AWN9_NELNU|nr:PREDICTED: probable ubiquitin-conjugating enzyme E2 24 isoform X2 [Nelumbo nucifera]
MEILLSESDCESFSESSGSDYQDDIESMYGGKAQSILSNLEESIEKIDDFLAFERGFLHGDIVCSATDPSGQMGRVMDVDMVVDLETVCGEVIKNVNSKNLLRICSFSSGDYVVHGPWLGRVHKVVDRVTIVFDDGAKCELTAAGPETLLPMSSNLLDDAQYPYYPGQNVRASSSTIFKTAKWLSGVWKENRYEGTVCHVEAGLVYVDWVASAIVGYDMNLPAPSCQQDSKDLTLLSCFPYANWQLGDWCLLPVDDQRGTQEQVFLNFDIQSLTNWRKRLQQQQIDLNLCFQEMYVIVKIKTKVDVLWQDGSHSIGLDSQSLFPVNSVGDHEFWPEQLVLEKCTNDDLHVSSGQRLGIVKSVDAKERTVNVKWRTPFVQAIDLGIECVEETVSAYELIEHPDCSYSHGDVVFKFKKNNIQAEGMNENHDNHLKTDMEKCSFQLSGESHLKSKDNIEDCDHFTNNCYLSCIGIVTGFFNGSIEVRWANGLTSKVGPYEIVGIEKSEESESAATHVPYDGAIEDSLSKGMLDHGKQSSELKEKVPEKAFEAVGEECKKDIFETSVFSFPRAAIGFFSNVAASLFGSCGSISLSGSMNSSHFGGLIGKCKPDLNRTPLENMAKSGSLHEKEELKYCNVNIEGRPSVVDDLLKFRETNLKQKIEKDQGEKGLIQSGSENLVLFKQFDIVSNCKDHHFVNGSGKELILSQMKKCWLRKVQQEWSILEKDLPDTIYVRIYEERMDLLRAAIVGAPGTPYHDGLFFFDFFLPPDYPHEPPLVHYNSGGLRLNPNLYESGRICLSLLKTWTGTGTEVWNPVNSTILQVLLSLQALVLNEKPYFNEAGYDKHIGRAEGEKNSVTYNENAFLLSCKSMLYVLRNPPMHFEALVEEHFRSRSRSILLACKEYMEGCPVGCAFGRGVAEQETQRRSSTGFRIMLAKIFPQLVKSFTNKGFDCSQFIDPGNGVEK